MVFLENPLLYFFLHESWIWQTLGHVMNMPFLQFFNFSKMALLNIHNMPQGPANPGFMQEKVQNGDFLKKPSRELKFSF